MRARTIARVLALALLCVTGSAWAQTFTGGTKPYVLQGKIAADQAGAQQSGWFGVSVGTVGQPDTPVRWIGVSAFNTWDDDPFVGRQVLRTLMPNQPTLLVTGPGDMLSKLQNAPVGNKVVLRGMLVPESRNFMLSAVQILPPTATMPD
jgi:hypothetical protein